MRRRSEMKLGPGSSEEGEKRQCHTRPAGVRATSSGVGQAVSSMCLLAALLDVVAHELLRVLLEDLVDLVEEVVELGLEPLSRLGGLWRLFEVPPPPDGCSAPAVASAPALPSAISYATLNLVNRSAGEALALSNSSVCSAVPRSGSIIGTRRNGSVPRSNTIESQFALATEDAQRFRH